MSAFDVSIIMPNFNCEPYIAASIRSALDSVGVTVEVVFVDDASSDSSVAVARAMAEEFPGRVQVHSLEKNSGSAVARNMALRHATGRWLAVLDSDDLMYPQRLAKLIEAADAQGAAIIADDLLTFYDDGKRAPHGLLGGKHAQGGHRVSLADFVRGNPMYGPYGSLGYVKPMVRADAWRASDVWYDPALRLAQDYDFLLRLLEHGLDFYLLPEPWYFYRKHSSSNSAKLKRPQIEALKVADLEFAQRIAGQADVEAARRERHASLDRALAFDTLVGAIKGRQWGTALAEMLRHPDAAALLALPVRARIERFRRRDINVQDGANAAVLTSRRLDDAGRAHLDTIAHALRAKSLSPRLVQPFAPDAQTPDSFPAADLASFDHITLAGWERRGDRFVRVAPTAKSEPQAEFEPLMVALSAYPALDAVLIDTPQAAEAESFLIRPVEKRLAWDEKAGALVAA
ncbi:glycosyltransferase family 2 protein [Novosphingobium sp. KACC 22771]|uniref:glycosyltransferase family 2 protein n=1 Tax=Novosphingobium sp. KACC 22771 TaxID=3025670 RepID=UPI002365BF58|nr:glycosyltransferase family 2 protein [Novosphingobium sp. KACC 22771]WDF72962.1 glycosyltransferase family 2 protein [Novosphingobium sp. KACC 22771]